MSPVKVHGLERAYRNTCICKAIDSDLADASATTGRCHCDSSRQQFFSDFLAALTRRFRRARPSVSAEKPMPTRSHDFT